MIVVLLFLALNFLLFLPRYILNAATTPFLPFKELFENKKFNLGKLFSRFNNDLFRINIEFTCLTLVLCAFKTQMPEQVAVFSVVIFYIVTLFLFYYHYIIYGIYKTYPSFTTDLKFIKQGISIAYNGYKMQLVFAFIGFLLFLVFLYYLNFYFVGIIYGDSTNYLFVLCLSILLLNVVFSIVKKATLFQFKVEFDFHYLTCSTFQSSIKIINSNHFFSQKNEIEIKNIPHLIEESIFDFPEETKLKTMPNVYFIAIESYGAILYENEEYQQIFKELAEAVTTKLNENKWHIASSLSQAPVSGGGSWMSYSSLLKGIDIKTDSLYRNLIQKRKQFQNQSVFTILEAFGYHNFLISGVGGFENFKIDWEENLEFIGAKNKIVYKDLSYKGIRFNFGPSAPDQYFLNKSFQLMKGRFPNQPISCFVETINSHIKFHSPTVILDEWRDCNSASIEDFQPTENLDKNSKENYLKAIEYQFKNLESLIINEKSDSIFIVFGDHQPALLTNYTNSFQTPIHIISKNKSFIDNWKESGFTSSIYIRESVNELHHFNLKKLFLTYFMRSYKN